MNANPPPSTQAPCPRALLVAAFEAGIAAVDPANCLTGFLERRPVPGRTVLVGIGKAAVAMVAAAHEILGDRIEGIALTRYGHTGGMVSPATIEVVEAGHPVPDDNGIAAARRIVALAETLSGNDRFIMLVSGGGSSLLALPGHGVSLEDKQSLSRALLASGATVQEMNCVRKHLSAIKGGRLAVAAAPARIETYCISDVAGDLPQAIASGPTVADVATLAEARAVLARHSLDPPPSVIEALSDPRNALPPVDHPAFRHAKVEIVARSRDALAATARTVAEHGYEPVILGDDLEGEARSLGARHAELALEYLARGGRHALISGGECTVRLGSDRGRGGPNAEYLLALAIGLNGAPGVAALAADTDGIDGNGDNAGAFIDASSLRRARSLGIEFSEALATNSSYDAFARLGDLLITGPTLTNVNDLRIILVDGGASKSPAVGAGGHG